MKHSISFALSLFCVSPLSKARNVRVIMQLSGFILAVMSSSNSFASEGSLGKVDLQSLVRIMNDALDHAKNNQCIITAERVDSGVQFTLEKQNYFRLMNRQGLVPFPEPVKTASVTYSNNARWSAFENPKDRFSEFISISELMLIPNSKGEFAGVTGNKFLNISNNGYLSAVVDEQADLGTAWCNYGRW